MGVLLVLPDDLSDKTLFVPHYRVELGRLYVLLYANRFDSLFDHMARYINPTTNLDIGMSICSVDVLAGEGVAEIEVTGTETALATRIISLVPSDVTLERCVWCV